MAIAGRVAIVPKGDWDSSEAYKRLDAVTYNNILYIAKKVVPKNTAVTNTDYWMPSVAGGVAVKATTTNIGQVQPDGETIEVDADGKISAKTALDTKPTIIATAEPNIVDTVEASMLVTNATKNLLKPVLGTTTQNGITCTNNGDGTYTLNGTATDSIFFNINKNISINKGTKYKVVCFKDEDYIRNKITSCVRRVDTTAEYVFDNGTFVSDAENCWLWIEIVKGVTVSNLVAKPMITTDLNATYDDFVPYDGYEIKSCGKNLLNYPVWSKDISADSRGTFVYENNGVTINATGNDAYTGQRFGNTKTNITVHEGEIITLSWEANNNLSGLIYIFPNGKTETDGVYKMVYADNESAKKITYTVPAGVTFIQFRFGVRNAGDSISYKNIQIERGSARTEFEPYTESTVQITPSTEFPLLGLKSFDGETNIISPGNVEVAFAKNDSGKAILGMCKPTVKNLVSTVEGNPLDATMGAQLKKEIDELKAKVDAMSTSTTTE